MKPQGVSLIWYVHAVRRWSTGRRFAGQPRLFYRDSQTLVAWRPAQTDQPADRLVVVFQSARRRNLHPDRLDFAEIAADGGRNHVLFVCDRHVSWFSRPGQRDLITRIIRNFAATRGIETIWAIGNSMGGYGAILFSNALSFARVVAFAPQLNLSETVICRPNWDRYRPSLNEQTERDLVPILAEAPGRTNIVYGDQDEDDLLHYGHLRETLSDAPDVRIVIVRGKDHRVASWLNERGQLADVVNALWRDDFQALDDCSRKLETPLEYMPA